MKFAKSLEKAAVQNEVEGVIWNRMSYFVGLAASIKTFCEAAFVIGWDAS